MQTSSTFSPSLQLAPSLGDASAAVEDASLADADEANSPVAYDLRDRIGGMRAQVLRVFPDQDPPPATRDLLREDARAPTNRRSSTTDPQNLRVPAEGIPVLQTLRSRALRYAATVNVEAAVSSDLASTTREERAALLLGVPPAHLVAPRAPEQREDARAERAAAADATLSKDPRAVAALGGIDASGVADPTQFRLVSAAVLTMLLDDGATDAFEVAYEVVSQDWVEELARAGNIENKFRASETRAAFIAASLRRLVRDIAAAGCATRAYGTRPAPAVDEQPRHGRRTAMPPAAPAAAGGVATVDRAVFADDVVRSLLVVLCMWRVATGQMRRLQLLDRAAAAGVTMTAASPVASPTGSPARIAGHTASPADDKLRPAWTPSPLDVPLLDAAGGRRVHVGRKPRTTAERLDAALILKSSYAVGVDATKRAVTIPDMLPLHVRQSGLCLGRKVAREAAQHKVACLEAIDHEERLRHVRRLRAHAQPAVDASASSASREHASQPPALVGLAGVDDVVRARSATPGLLDGPGPAPNIETPAKRCSPPRDRHRTSATPPPPIYVSQQRRRNDAVRERTVFTLDTSSVLKRPAQPSDGSPPEHEAPPDHRQGAASRAFKCHSKAMAEFNRFVFDRDKAQHALMPERSRREGVEKRHEKRRNKAQRDLMRAIALASPPR